MEWVNKLEKIYKNQEQICLINRIFKKGTGDRKKDYIY